MEPRFNDLVAQLQAAHGENLLSVIAYGSAIAAPETAKPADFMTVVVIKHLGTNDMNKTRGAAQWWVERGHPLPVYFTAQEFQESLDVFAVEFRQMKRAYRVLAGTDVLAGREASSANLRSQIEYELRGKLLRLRSLYLTAGSSTERLTTLMTDSIGSFIRYMRPILELLGEAAPLERRAVAQRIGERLALDTSPLERILRLRDEPVALLEIEAQDLFAAYVDCLRQIIEKVDKL